MQANVDAKTGITRSFITLGYSDSTLKGVLPVDTVIKAMRKSKSNIVKKELARDIDGKVVDYEINVKTDNQAIGNIVLSAEYYIRVSECNGKTTLGSKVLYRKILEMTGMLIKESEQEVVFTLPILKVRKYYGEML